MMDHPLDTPVRSALSSRHAAFAESLGRTIRYAPSILPMASDDPDDPHALSRLVGPGEAAAVVKPGRFDPLPGFDLAGAADLFQMVFAGRAPAPDDPRIVQLGAADVPDMMALADRTRPGPITSRALDIGRFWGIRQNGRLVAMAGERMTLTDFTEVSGICTDAEVRGQGLGRALTQHVTARIAATGSTPYLHVVTGNIPAVRLYEDLGFETRTLMYVNFMRRVDQPAAALP